MVIDPNDVNRLVNFYWDNIENLTHSGSMNKISVNEYWSKGLGDILSSYISDIPVGDNFYRHNYPYLPHADYREGTETFNYVIPLETNSEQKFIVFDQTIKCDGRTWVGDLEFDHSVLEPNSAIKESFYESGLINGLTDQDIDDELYSHLPFFEKDYYFGMTGNVYEWVPGKVIKFDSRKIHATGSMTDDFKLGLTLRMLQ